MSRSLPARIHGFELHEQPWIPEALRNALTEWLRVLWAYSRAEIVLAPLLQTALNASGAERIVDLCSGRSGPIVRIQSELACRGVRIPVTLTDKFPDRNLFSALAEASHGQITACFDSVDVTAVPENVTGFRTLFNSFHHFRPGDARRILNDACIHGQPIGIFEITARTLCKVVLCFPASFFSCYLLIWRMSPRRLSWWILTWLFPVIPVMVGWDAFVSHLRSYTKAEMKELTRGLGDASWHWEQGRVSAPRGGVEITFLIGTPVLPGKPHSG